MTRSTIILSIIAFGSLLTTACAVTMLRDANRIEHLKAQCAVIYPVSDVTSICIRHNGKPEEIYGRIVWTPAQR